jgi:hypothetical protein
MNPGRLTLFARLAWIEAYILHFDREVMRARAVLATRRPTLDEAATFVAVKVHDGLARPDVAIAEP